MRGQRNRLLGALFLGAVLALAPSGIPARAGERALADARLSWGYDSNVKEMVRSAAKPSDNFARIEAAIDVGAVAKRQGGVHAGLRWAGECFTQYRTESRTMVRGMLGWRWVGRGRWAECGWSSTRFDRPAADSLDLKRHELTHSAELALTRRARLYWAARGLWIRPDPRGPSARCGWQLAVEMKRTIAHSLRISARLEGGEVRFDVLAIEGWVGGENVYRDEKQRDRNVLCGVGLARSGVPLLSFFYGYRKVDSNSFGFSFGRHELSLTAAFLLPHRVSLQLAGRLQEPRYSERGFDSQWLRENPDESDLGARSGLTLQLRRPIGGGLSLEVRATRQRNEGRTTGRFYEKTRLVASACYGGSG